MSGACTMSPEAVAVAKDIRDARFMTVRPKSLPAAPLAELLTAGYARKYGRGRSHGVVLTPAGVDMLSDQEAPSHGEQS